MTNQGPRRAAAEDEWLGRLAQAREFHESARSLVTHEKFFRRLLGRKDEVNYGARGTGLAEAERLLAELDDFASWMEATI